MTLKFIRHIVRTLKIISVQFYEKQLVNLIVSAYVKVAF